MASERSRSTKNGTSPLETNTQHVSELTYVCTNFLLQIPCEINIVISNPWALSCMLIALGEWVYHNCMRRVSRFS